MSSDVKSRSYFGGFTFGILGQDGSQVGWSSVPVFVPGDDPEVVFLTGQQALDVTLAGRHLNGLAEEFHLGILPQHLVADDVAATIVHRVRPGEGDILLGYHHCLQIDHWSRDVYRNTGQYKKVIYINLVI